MLTYEEVAALTKHDRVVIREDFTGRHIPGTITGSGTFNASPSLWIKFDGDTHQTNIPTGMQFTKDAWVEMSSSTRFIAKLSLFEQEEPNHDML